VTSADGRAVTLVSVLDRLPFFRDTAPYRGRVVPFYKRAQLAACDLIPDGCNVDIAQGE